jgi:hypothetical protein
MASSVREVCAIVRNFFESIPSEHIVVPMGLLETIIPAIEWRLSNNGPFKIVISRKVWGHRNLRGMFHRYSDRAEVSYSNGLNLCWTRFVICKEISHLVIDCKKQNFTHDPVELVQQLIAGGPSLNKDDGLQSEHLAAVAAIELLLPWKLRGEIKAMVNNGITDLEIALKFRVPEHVVTYLVRSKYWDVSLICHSEIV